MARHRWRRRTGIGVAALVLLLGAGVISGWGRTSDRDTGRYGIGFSMGGSYTQQAPADIDADTAEVAHSGARWIRVDIDWDVIEHTSGALDWALTDRAVSQAERDGLDVIGLVSYTPPWARALGTPKTAPPLRDDDFARFAGLATRRYSPGVRTWEVWNEPNLVTFWATGPDPVRYGRLLKAASSAMRATDTRATILSGGLAAVPDAPPGRIDPLTFLRGLYVSGARSAFDGVSVHPYTYPNMPDFPDSYFAKLVALHGEMEARGDSSKDLWITEFGAPTYSGPGGVTPDRQADMLANAFALANAHPWIAAFLVYTLRDPRSADVGDPEQHFGLRDGRDAAKPAWDVFEREADLRRSPP